MFGMFMGHGRIGELLLGWLFVTRRRMMVFPYVAWVGRNLHCIDRIS
jgi:hypothetical protein